MTSPVTPSPRANHDGRRMFRMTAAAAKGRVDRRILSPDPMRTLSFIQFLPATCNTGSVFPAPPGTATLPLRSATSISPTIENRTTAEKHRCNHANGLQPGLQRG